MLLTRLSHTSDFSWNREKRIRFTVGNKYSLPTFWRLSLCYYYQSVSKKWLHICYCIQQQMCNLFFETDFITLCINLAVSNFHGTEIEIWSTFGSVEKNLFFSIIRQLLRASFLRFHQIIFFQKTLFVCIEKLHEMKVFFFSSKCINEF